LLSLRAARACAALDGRAAVNADDAVLAARLVLAPRATEVALAPEESAADPPAPAEPEETEPSAHEDPEDAAQQSTPETGANTEVQPDSQSDSNQLQRLEDVVLAAARAAIPEGLLARLRALALRGPARAAGRSGDERKSGLRGRPAGVRQGRPGAQGRLSVIDTLRAAAPWQRSRQPAPADASRALVFHPDDFRIRRHRMRTEPTTIFAVDASGSSALHRLAEAKGAVELLLADCYVRRDRVAVVAFRGRIAEVLLPPTRSLARAKKQLAGLPGGGGTPLAAGLDATRGLVEAVRRRGGTPSVVVLTDGQANVARDGSGGRERAGEEARQAARLLRAAGTRAVVIDTGQRPHPLAQRLAQDMGARYVALPHAGARAISEAARAGLAQ
jgi:magnesium chelatase subunit D